MKTAQISINIWPETHTDRAWSWSVSTCTPLPPHRKSNQPHESPMGGNSSPPWEMISSAMFVIEPKNMIKISYSISIFNLPPLPPAAWQCMSAVAGHEERGVAVVDLQPHQALSIRPPLA